METTNDERPTDELICQLLQLDSEEDGYWDILTVLWRRATTDTLLRARQLCESPSAAERKLGADVLGQLGTKPDVLHEERLELLLTLLSRETEPDVLAAACIGLSHLYDPKADGPIIRLKDHPDEDVRYSVAFGLTGDRDNAVTATLMELSADVASDVRDWATFRLGMMEAAPPEVLDALADRLTDEDEDTRAEAIVGLSRRKDQRALEPLIECLNQLKAGENQGYDYAEGLLYEAAAELEDPRLCPALLKLESRTAVYSSLPDAIVKCGCKEL
jgi:hypothetical protein